MAIDAPPFGAVRNFETIESLRRKDRAISGRADELRRLGADDEVPYLGANNVGADEDIRLRGGAAGEDEAYGGARLLKVHQLMIECDRSSHDTTLEYRVQIAAMVGAEGT